MWTRRRLYQGTLAGCCSGASTVGRPQKPPDAVSTQLEAVQAAADPVDDVMLLEAVKVAVPETVCPFWVTLKVTCVPDTVVVAFNDWRAPPTVTPVIFPTVYASAVVEHVESPSRIDASPGGAGEGTALGARGRAHVLVERDRDRSLLSIFPRSRRLRSRHRSG